MSRAVQRKIATYEDLLAVPDHQVAEILDGELFASPRPAVRHAHGGSGLGVDILGQFHYSGGGRPGGWWILFEPELHLGEDVLVPDMAGWGRAGGAPMPGGAGVGRGPDWVCEV